MSVRVSRSRTKLGQIALARQNVKKGDGRKLVSFAQISTCTSLNMLSMPNSISNICIFQQKKHTKPDSNLHRECRAKQVRFCKIQCKCINQRFWSWWQFHGGESASSLVLVPHKEPTEEVDVWRCAAILKSAKAFIPEPRSRKRGRRHHLSWCLAEGCLVCWFIDFKDAKCMFFCTVLLWCLQRLKGTSYCSLVFVPLLL